MPTFSELRQEVEKPVVNFEHGVYISPTFSELQLFKLFKHFKPTLT